jgi:hypothetical protein
MALIQGRTFKGAVVWRDAAALARDAACWKDYVEIYSQRRFCREKVLKGD